MGVDWYPCKRCGTTYPDCGDYVSCSCGKSWCSDKCAEEDGYIQEYCKLGKLIDDQIAEEECEFADKDNNCWQCSDYVEESCKYCREEDFDDAVLLEYALVGLKMSREELIECFMADKEEEIDN